MWPGRVVFGVQELDYNRNFRNFSSPNYPSLYPTLQRYRWTLRVPERNYIKLTVHSFDVEGQQHYPCLFDAVYIYNVTPLRLLGVFCGHLAGLPWTLFIRSRAIWFSFYSDRTVKRNGFTVSFSSVEIDDRKYS